MICGYVTDNITDDFICPICGEPHTSFQKINKE